MNNFFRRALKSPFVIGQRLTKIPRRHDSVVSDLFVWRADKDWNTYFKLFNISSFCGEDRVETVNLVIFDDHGNKIYSNKIQLNEFSINTLNIGKILSNLDLKTSFGTFSIFHSKNLDLFKKYDSYCAERGYVGYSYKNMPLKSYIHGNLDAVDNNLFPLGGTSLISRKYNLQFSFNFKSDYEVAIVNNTNKPKRVLLNINQSPNDIKSQVIQPLGVKIFLLGDLSVRENFHINLKSRLIMARPIVFRIDKNDFDIFHG